MFDHKAPKGFFLGVAITLLIIGSLGMFTHDLLDDAEKVILSMGIFFTGGFILGVVIILTS